MSIIASVDHQESDLDLIAKYAELNILRKNWPNVPIMALTGSANKDAIEDIKHNLAMRNPVCLAQSFNRPNLHYSVRKKPTLKKDLAQNIAGFIKTHHPTGTGIIYVLSRADTEDVAQKLREEWGIEARHYHAGIDNEERKLNQDDWMSGRCKVIVATVCLGYCSVGQCNSPINRLPLEWGSTSRMVGSLIRIEDDDSEFYSSPVCHSCNVIQGHGRVRPAFFDKLTLALLISQVLPRDGKSWTGRKVLGLCSVLVFLFWSRLS